MQQFINPKNSQNKNKKQKKSNNLQQLRKEKGDRMKELWYISTILLFFGALAGFANTPTGAFASNLPPTWELPTDEFSSADGKITIPLEKAFFDPDGDTIAFSTETKEATATIQKGG